MRLCDMGECKKRSFVMRDEDGEAFDMMTNEQAGMLIKAIFAYRRTKQKPPDDADCMVRLAFLMIQKKLDHDEEVWLSKQQNGSRGGKAKASKNAIGDSECVANCSETVANDSEDVANAGVTVTATVTDTVTATDTVTVTDTATVTEKRKRRKTRLTVEEEQNMITESGIPAQVAVVLDQWCVYKDEKGEPYTPTGFKTLLTKIKKYIEKYGINATVDGIEQSMASGWKGVFVSKESQKPKDRYAVVDDWLESVKSGEEVSPFA